MPTWNSSISCQQRHSTFAVVAIPEPTYSSLLPGLTQGLSQGCRQSRGQNLPRSLMVAMPL
ncbi:MAG: hypothetical protein ACI8VR_001432 [Candidatus Azotimanducaceae bacterium]|jgi:hypothetical protein